MRILVVQTAFLGDVVLTTPLLRELVRANPTAKLAVLTTATGADALGGLSAIDELRVYDKSWGRAGRSSSRATVRWVRRGGFGAAVAAHRSFRSGVLVRLSGAPVRVGFAGAPGSWAYTHRVRRSPEQHAVRRYLELATALGSDPASWDPQPALAVDPLARRRVQRLLEQDGIANAPLVCIAPGSIWATKRWLPEGFAAVARWAEARGYTPVLVGAPGERELCLHIAGLAGGRTPVLAGRTRVDELIALVACARAVVANDSGPAHVAAAVGTPVVSVFGPTSSRQGYAAFGPLVRVVEHAALRCRPCDRHGPRACPLGHFRCMREIDAGAVIEQLDALLHPEAAPRSGQLLPG